MRVRGTMENKLLDCMPDIKIIDDADLPEKVSGLYIETSSDKIIMLNKNINTEAERKCVLAEEIGHYKKTVGNIIVGNDLSNMKQENIARRWAYNKLVPLSSFLEAFKLGVTSKQEFIDYLDVTEPFLNESIGYYQLHFGPYVRFNDYLIYFEPVGVFKMSD